MTPKPERPDRPHGVTRADEVASVAVGAVAVADPGVRVGVVDAVDRVDAAVAVAAAGLAVSAAARRIPAAKD